MNDVTVVWAGRVVPTPDAPALADRRIVLRHGQVQEIGRVRATIRAGRVIWAAPDQSCVHD